MDMSLRRDFDSALRTWLVTHLRADSLRTNGITSELAEVSQFRRNVFYHLSGNISHPVAPKTTKNCTLIFRQWLNNKFQNFIISLLYLF